MRPKPSAGWRRERWTATSLTRSDINGRTAASCGPGSTCRSIATPGASPSISSRSSRTSRNGGRSTHRSCRLRSAANVGRAHAVCAAERRRRDLGHGLHHRRAAVVRDPRIPVRSRARNVRWDVRRVRRAHSSRGSGVRASKRLAKAMESGADFSVQNRSIRPDGAVRWLSGAGRVLLGERGEPVRGIGISLDVTERRTLEGQYQQAQKMEAVGRLAGGVAHDFNNLLTAILGYCELLLDDIGPDDPSRRDITEIQKAGERAAGLTRQLLAFSRKQIIEPTLLDLNVIVADMRADARTPDRRRREDRAGPSARAGAREGRSRAGRADRDEPRGERAGCHAARRHADDRDRRRRARRARRLDALLRRNRVPM